MNSSNGFGTAEMIEYNRNRRMWGFLDDEGHQHLYGKTKDKTSKQNATAARVRYLTMMAHILLKQPTKQQLTTFQNQVERATLKGKR